jgi:hypothetical protein
VIKARSRKKVISQVDSAKEKRPRMRSRIVSVTIREPLVRLPHDGLQFEELGEETRSAVIDFASFLINCGYERED